MLISEKELPKYYGDIVKEELNIKEVELGADLSKYVNFEIKPNLPVLGKLYGKLIPEIKKQIDSKNQMELATKIQNGGSEYITIGEEEIELNKENLLVMMQGIEGFAFAGEKELGIVLDTHISEELKEEGYLREVLSKVQNMRKDRGFEVLDRINLYIAGNSMLEEVVKKYEKEISKDTLSEKILYNEKRETYVETSINGEKLNIDVEVI